MCKKAMSSGAGAGAAEPPQNRPYPKPWCGDTEYSFHLFSTGFHWKFKELWAKKQFHQFQIYLLKIGEVPYMLYIKAKKLSDKYTQGLICSAT